MIEEKEIIEKELKEYKISIEALTLKELKAIDSHLIFPLLSNEQKNAIFKKIDKMCISEKSEHKWLTYWLIHKDGCPAGLIGFKGLNDDQTVEVGYGTFADSRRKGVMSEALSMLSKWAFTQKPGIVITASNVLKSNKGSLKVLKKNGFKLVKDEATMDFVLTDNKMHMRRAYGSDAERIAEINVFAWRMAYYRLVDENFLFSIRSVARTAEKLKSRIVSGESEMYVYEENGIIKGFISISEKDQLELIAIYVEPSFWNQGIGSEMIDFFESLAQKRSISDLHIWVLEDNEPARKFYEKHKYQNDGATKIIESINRIACLYTKCLGQEESL